MFDSLPLILICSVMQLRDSACRGWGENQVCGGVCGLWQDPDRQQTCESLTDSASTEAKVCWLAFCDSGCTVHPHTPTVLQAAGSGN